MFFVVKEGFIQKLFEFVDLMKSIFNINILPTLRFLIFLFIFTIARFIDNKSKANNMLRLLQNATLIGNKSKRWGHGLNLD